MRTLYVIYDGRCGLCAEIRNWLLRQRVCVPLRFVAGGSPEATKCFPTLPPGDLAVVSDSGEFWLGDHAWIICLWALREYRRWSFRLARPALQPFVRQAFAIISSNRRSLSQRLGLFSDFDLRSHLEQVALPVCEIGPK